jgi:hypothetical protein
MKNVGCITENGPWPSVDGVDEGLKTTTLSEGDLADFCPYCRSPFEIIHVKFRFNGTAMIATCPNCAITCADQTRSENTTKKLAVTWGSLQGDAKMHSLDKRFRYVIAFLIAAVITAAALRHIVHVYGGIPREEIRWDAMTAIPLVAAVIVLFRRRRVRK